MQEKNLSLAGANRKRDLEARPNPTPLNSRLLCASSGDLSEAPTLTGRVANFWERVVCHLERPMGTDRDLRPNLEVGTVNILHACLQLDKVIRSLHL